MSSANPRPVISLSPMLASIMFFQGIRHDPFEKNIDKRQPCITPADVLSQSLVLPIISTACVAPGRVAQSVGHLNRKSGVLGSIPGLGTYFRVSFHFFKKGSCQLLAKVWARSTG